MEANTFNGGWTYERHKTRRFDFIEIKKQIGGVTFFARVGKRNCHPYTRRRYVKPKGEEVVVVFTQGNGITALDAGDLSGLSLLVCRAFEDFGYEFKRTNNTQ